MMSNLCPAGSYCGVANANITDIRNCSACQWGYRPDELSVCQRCDTPMSLYEWMYLGFMVLLSFVLHCIAIDVHTNRKSRRMLWLYLSVTLETAVAALSALLLIPPVGTLNLNSCGVNSIRDWYPVFFNPVIYYTTRLTCTQEMVYPLYTLVMILYAMQLPAMMLLRPIFSHKSLSKQGIDTCKPVYSALYFLPLLVLVHAAAGGALYYCYPYVTLLVSAVTLVVHVSQYDSESPYELLIQSVLDGRSCAILLLHWLLHAYGMLALVDVPTNGLLTGCLMLLIPVPYILYIVTARHTSPSRIDRILGHLTTN